MRQLRQDGGFFLLPVRALIRVTGADRLRYLNGQLSNDLKRLAPDRAMRALALTAKGKLCAVVWVWLDGDAVIVESDEVLGDALLARLERYAVSDDVSFARVDPVPPLWHVFGPAAAGCAGLQIDRLGGDGRDTPVRPTGFLEASESEREILRIERGLPVWGRELNEDTLPHEAGLDRAAVDFHKGCYVGQETVSRIESVGRVNRQLAGFLGDFDPSLAPNAKLLDASGAPAGYLTSAASCPGQQKTAAMGYFHPRTGASSFSVVDESGACLGRAERSEFPLVSE